MFLDKGTELCWCNLWMDARRDPEEVERIIYARGYLCVVGFGTMSAMAAAIGRTSVV